MQDLFKKIDADPEWYPGSRGCIKDTCTHLRVPSGQVGVKVSRETSLCTHLPRSSREAPGDGFCHSGPSREAPARKMLVFLLENYDFETSDPHWVGPVWDRGGGGLRGVATREEIPFWSRP